MKFAPILALLSGCLLMTACAGSPAVGAKMAPLPENVRAPCPGPSAFLDAGDWELMAGRLGDELILCGKKHRAAVAYAGHIEPE